MHTGEFSGRLALREGKLNKCIRLCREILIAENDFKNEALIRLGTAHGATRQAFAGSRVFCRQNSTELIRPKWLLCNGELRVRTPNQRIFCPNSVYGNRIGWDGKVWRDRLPGSRSI